jgi:predicted DCC family thiol-disulfide oxidoreductase YuxK
MTIDLKTHRMTGAKTTEMIFYDGYCGMCHRGVRLILAMDRAGVFRFAPLDSEAFRASIPEESRASLPDSIVVQTASGELVVKSGAILYVMHRLGGVWRLLSIVARAIPKALRDYLYDRVAGVRHRLFAKPVGDCPIIPAEFRGRFEL